MPQRRAATARNSSTSGGGFDSDLLHRLGLAVKVARVGRALSQRELAEKVGRSQNLIWTVESGKKDPGVVLLARIAEALRMPLEFFLIPILSPRTATPSEQKREFEEGRGHLISLMEAFAVANYGPDEDKGTKEGKPSGRRSRL